MRGLLKLKWIGAAVLLFCAALFAADRYHFNKAEIALQNLSDHVVLASAAAYNNEVPNLEAFAIQALQAQSNSDDIEINLQTRGDDLSVTLRQPYTDKFAGLFSRVISVQSVAALPGFRGEKPNLRIHVDVENPAFDRNVLETYLRNNKIEGHELKWNGKLSYGRGYKAVLDEDPDDFIIFVTDNIARPGLCQALQSEKDTDLVFLGERSKETRELLKVCSGKLHPYGCSYGPLTVEEIEDLPKVLQSMAKHAWGVRISC